MGLSPAAIEHSQQFTFQLPLQGIREIVEDLVDYGGGLQGGVLPHHLRHLLLHLFSLSFHQINCVAPDLALLP